MPLLDRSRLVGVQVAGFGRVPKDVVAEAWWVTRPSAAMIAPASDLSETRVNVPGDRLRTQLAGDGISTALADLEEERGTFRRLARKVRRNVVIGSAQTEPC
jgi:hypothetical protein